MKTLAGMTVAGFLLLLLCVWERVDIVRVGYQIEQLKKQKDGKVAFDKFETTRED